jgi:rubrerythrin
MPDELDELLDTAIYKEISSQAFYIAGQDKTEDPSASALMRELAKEELKHARWLEALKEGGLGEEDWRREKVANLMISEYLTGGDSLEGASLQDTLLFAMKREQQSVEFYSRMMGMMKDETAKHLCERLVHEELKHKLKLEILYDDMLADVES